MWSTRQVQQSKEPWTVPDRIAALHVALVCGSSNAKRKSIDRIMTVMTVMTDIQLAVMTLAKEKEKRVSSENQLTNTDRCWHYMTLYKYISTHCVKRRVFKQYKSM
jgi:hypothetical protein